MAGVSASHLIIFIASMMVAASVVGVFTDSVNQLSNAISEQGVDVSSDVRSDIEIISDSGSAAIYNTSGNENITLHLKNTGTEQLPARGDRLDIFVNGVYQADVTVTLLGDAGTWNAGDVVRVEIPEPLDPGDHRVKIIVNSDEEVFEFRT